MSCPQTTNVIVHPIGCMSHLRPHALIAAASLLLLLGCSDSDQGYDFKPQGARLSSKQAVQLAKQAAERQSVSLGDFMTPTARYRLTGDKSWAVYFEGRGAKRGTHFLVLVDDQTEATRCLGDR